jgi:hypothetical protein
MTFHPIFRRAIRLTCLFAACVSAGCGRTYHVAEVDGQLLAKGQPAGKVKIQFIPDIDRGTKGPVSMAETDAAGHFTLEWKERGEDSARPGATVGWHRVVLSDMKLAESETGQGVPIRFGSEYTQPSSTPLRQEVKEGKQTIEIAVP